VYAYELVQRDYAEACKWYHKAAENRNKYAGELSRDELAESQRRSAQLFEGIQQRKAGLLEKTTPEPES